MNVLNNNRQNPMSQNPDSQTDHQVEEALSNFRLSMRAWSDHELDSRPAKPFAQPARSLPVRSSSWLMAPALSWAAAAVLTIAAVGVPLGVRHHNAVLAEQAKEQAVAEARQHPIAAQQLPEIAVSKADDDQLLQHVDTDIAQDTPDALQPLASLMSSSGAE